MNKNDLTNSNLTSWLQFPYRFTNPFGQCYDFGSFSHRRLHIVKPIYRRHLMQFVGKSSRFDQPCYGAILWL